MFYAFQLFILDIALWWLVPEVQTRFNDPLWTDIAFLLAFGVFMKAIAEMAELAFSIDGDVVDESKSDGV